MPIKGLHFVQQNTVIALVKLSEYKFISNVTYLKS